MRSKKSIAIILFVFTCLCKGFSQDGNLYVFNEKWEGISDVKKAKFLMEIRKVSDSSWQGWYYNFNGPLVRIESYKKVEGQVLNGRTSFYKSDGYLDSIINYKDDIPDGTSYYYGDTGRLETIKVFTHGTLIKEINKAQIEEKYRLDSINTISAVESEFPGGKGAWSRYLTKNLNYPERAYNNRFEGSVVVDFAVLEDGTLDEPGIFHSVEYSLDKEAMRMMKKSPKWIPGKKNDKIIKTYKHQPITFRLN